MSSGRSLLLTGATGFVGGTVLTNLLNSQLSAVKSLKLTVLVRKHEQAQILADKGIATVVLEGGLDDSEGLSELASKHDIVLHCATGFHQSSALAMIEGLGKRKKQQPESIDPVYVRLSGTTNLSVGDATGRGGRMVTFNDKKQDGIFEYEVEREKDLSYILRATDIKVIEAGERVGIKTYTVMPPPVVGLGTGLFKKTSEQIPFFVKNAIRQGQAEYIKPGTSSLGVVHVTDLAGLFEVLVNQIIIQPSLPSGKQGYFFASTGTLTWREVIEAIAKVGHRLGQLKTNQAVLIDLSEAASKFCDGDEAHTERLLASSSSTISERGYDIGWKPQAPAVDWEANVQDEIHSILKARETK